MSTIVAVFNQTTGWSGRSITYEDDRHQFVLQGHGPITACDVLDYDAQGQVDWARGGLSEWTRDFAEWERAHRTERPEAAQPSIVQVDDLPAPSASGEVERQAVRAPGGPAACPYCGVILDAPPKATKRCPTCGERMHLKRVAGTDERRLMTETDSEENDRAWKRVRLRKKAIRATELLGLSESEFLNAEQSLAARFGCAPGPGDVFWSLANREIGEAGRRGDWHRTSVVYGDMARWLHEEGRRSPFELLRQASIAELRGWASSPTFGPLAKVGAFDANDSHVCDACASSRDKTWTVAEALENPPVPHPDCANGFCRCTLSLLVV